MRKAIAYIRVSKQREGMLTIDTQKSKIRKYCDLHDIDLVAYYQDIDYSGRTSNRPDLQNMLSDIKENKIDVDVVLVYKIDRFSRSAKEFYYHISTLEKNDVNLISITQHFDSSTPMGRVLVNILIGFAQFESEMTGQRIKDNLQNNAERGRWHGGHIPYGYDWDEDNKLLYPNNQAINIKLIFQKYAEGYSLANIKDILYREGILSPTGMQEWNISVIADIIHHPLYIGKIRHNNKVYDGKHDGIIDTKLFNKANKLINDKSYKNRKHQVYTLSLLTKCSICGANGVYSCYTDQSNGKHYRRIRCGNRDCDMNTVDADSLTQAVLHKIIKLLDHKKYFKKKKASYKSNSFEEIKKLKQNKKQLLERKNKIDGIISNIFNDYYDNEIISREQFRNYTDKYNRQKKSILDQIGQVQTEIDNYSIDSENVDITKESIQALKEDINILTSADLNQALKIIVNKITVYKDKAIIDIYFDKLRIPVKKVHYNVLYF